MIVLINVEREENLILNFVRKLKKKKNVEKEWEWCI
jgi:hypothetical protein